MQIVFGSLVWLLASCCLAKSAPVLARRFLPTQGWPRSELFLRSVLVLTLTIVIATYGAGQLGLLGRWTLLAVALALAAVAAKWRGPKTATGLAPRRGLGGGLGGSFPFALTGGLVALDTWLALPTPPSSWDAMTYHLFLPARWLQEGRIFHVPTVFFDNHAAYAPQNGALYHAWNMALSGSDALTTAAQGLMILFAAVALYRLALELGVRRQAAAWITPLAALLVPVRHWGYSANVDIFMAAFFIGAVYWTLSFIRRGEAGSAFAAGLAAGLAAGTKTAGLALVAGPLAVLALALILRRRYGALAVAGGLAMLGGGFWFLQNLWLYGNPLFPLDFSLGPLHFDGAYRSAALRESFLNVDWPQWLGTVDLMIGRAAWIGGLAGTFLLLAAAKKRHRPKAAMLAAFVLAWAWFCYAIQPYNNQTRFLIPALWLSLCGWALVLERLPTRRSRAAAGASLTLILLLTATPLAALRSRLFKLASAEVDLGTLLAAAALPLLTLGLLYRAGRAKPAWRAATPWLTAAACWPLLISAFLECDRARPAFYAQTDFKVYAPGYLLFSDPSLEPQRIAYSGFSTPYVLMGPGWKHRVTYLETPALPGEGFHSYWRREPELHSSHKPGLYRRSDDLPQPWLARVDEEKIDFVALFAPFPVELPGHWPMDGKFLIERRWIQSHPQARPIVKTPVAEVYRIER